MDTLIPDAGTKLIDLLDGVSLVLFFVVLMLIYALRNLWLKLEKVDELHQQRQDKYLESIQANTEAINAISRVFEVFKAEVTSMLKVTARHGDN